MKEVVEKLPEENKQIEGINNNDVSLVVQGPLDMLSKGGSEIPKREERLYDIGELSDEKQDLLSAHEKYKFFKDNLKQSVQMNFPKTLKHGCNRSCKEEYLKNGFVYSKKHNAVFYIYCVLFLPSSKKQSLVAFVQRGYKEWHNILEKEKNIWEINTIKKSSSKSRVFAVVLKILNISYHCKAKKF